MKAKSREKPENKNRTRLTRELGRVLSVREADTQEDARTVVLSFSSEVPYERWFGTEILSHAEGAVDLSRLQDIGVLLFNHNTNEPVGQVVSAELDTGKHRCTATVRFDEDEESEKIYQKVKTGTLKGVSVGYTVSDWEEVENGETSTDGRFAGPCSIATRWTPMEISIVSVPADPTVGVGRSYESDEGQEQGENGPDEVEKPEEASEADNGKEPETDPGEPDEDNEPEKKAGEGETRMNENETPKQTPENEGARAAEAERRRVTEIMGMCRKFGMEPDEYIQNGTTVEDARAAIMEKMAATHTPTSIHIVEDEGDKFRAAAADGMAMRAGVTVTKPAAGAEEFRGKSMMRLAAECVSREQAKDATRMGDEELLRAAMTGSGAFPGILSNVAHKSMAQAYQAAPTTFQNWTAIGSNTDFKQATRYRLSEADDLVPMTETGEFEASEVTEGAATAAVATYGRTFSLTRKAIIDDDMGALSRIPALYGLAARRVINKLVYKTLTDNPTIEGAKLFDAKHGNVTGGTITVESLGKAKAMMARQKNLKGKEALNVQPAFLIVPPELEVTAAQLISSVVDPTKANATPNPFANRLTVVSDPELTDTAAWYLAAAPGILPSIEVTYLNGREEPTMESHVSFDTLGIKWRIYHDFGVNLLDYRGLLMSTGK